MSSLDPRIASGIAVIGMAARFPGASTVDEFWRNLCAGVESIRPLADDELVAAGLDPKELSNPRLVRAGALVDGIEEFDAAFFGIAAREAELMDPQHRLFLECAWQALEDAGYDPERYDGAIGVFGGGVFGSYAAHNLLAANAFDDKSGVLQTILANEKDYMTTRVSYKLNLRGPSYTVQSGCSTSLVAVHLACQNLLNAESDIAIAGGVAVDVGRTKGYYHHDGGIMSPDGHCRAFDARAQGTVFGNGVGMVVLKRLDDALRDGDAVHAVILGSATNNDGAHKVGFTAPSVRGQSEVIVEALADAGIDADTIGYVETHGTGTSLGDPIEIEAMARAFSASTPRKRFCAIGSVKTNIGHLDAAAGVAGFIKTVLALGRGLLPPSINFEQPNPAIRFDETPFFVNRTLTEWTAGTAAGMPRRAGVSAFGIGGTNAHIVLQEPPALPPTDAPRSAQLLVLSAKTPAALDAATERLASHLEGRGGLNLADVAYTLQVGRAVFAQRRYVVCRNTSEAIAALRHPAPVTLPDRTADSRNVVFLFPGQGAQYAGMARALYQHEPVFRRQLDICADILRSEVGLDLTAVLFPPAGNPAQVRAASERLLRTDLAQPALFAVEYALARVWIDRGIEPAACLGHSLGEYVAACLAGVFSLEDALRVVAARGRLMQHLPAGAMTAVPLPAADVQPLLDDTLSIAAINGPRSTVVAGPIDDIECFEQQLGRRSSWKRLATSHAFHSAMMDPILDRFAEIVAKVDLRVPTLPYVSNVTGTWVKPADAVDPKYWARHLRQPVRFGAGIEALADRGACHLLEVGPGRTLGVLARAISPDRLVVSSLPAAGEPASDDETMLEALGALWQRGVPVNWAALSREESRRRVSLPAYPFERKRYWVEPEKKEEPKPADPAKHEDIGHWFYLPEWRQTPPVQFYARGRTVPADANWLLFVDGSDLSVQVFAELAARLDSSRLVTVLPGERFERTSARSFVIDPRRREDYDTVARELAASGRVPDIVAHLWTAGTAAACSADDAERAQYRGFHSLVFLAQSVLAVRPAGAARPLAIKVVSRDMHAVTAADIARPEAATLLGVGLALPRERSDVRCLSIDIAAENGDGRLASRAVARLVDELTMETPETVVAHRAGRRWAPLFEPVVVEKDPQRPVLRPRGVYLITGGLGSIGTVLARHLARTVQARLVLVNRTPVPAPPDRDAYLATHSPHDAISARIRAIREMEALGAEVMVAAADVADHDQMKAVVAQAVERFGVIDGVVHASGLAGAGAIAGARRDAGAVLAPVDAIGPADAAAHFHAKMRGLYALEQVLGDRPLDFCMIVSSLSTVLGGPGYAMYAAANLFMDTFVHRHNHHHPVRWLSVAWDAWSFGGAPAAVERVTITPDEGVDVFERILSADGISHVVVSAVDLYARLAATAATQPAAEPERQEEQATYERPATATPFEPLQSDLERTVAGVWQQVLGVDHVGRRDNFFELGGHSLLAVQVAARLEDALQIEVPMRHVFDAATVADLAARIGAAKVARPAAQAVDAGASADFEELEI